MLSKEDNELTTRVGPGTVMGNLMRQYWVPALLSTELAQPGGAPVRVLLLGEKLIAFRDPAGRVGLVASACPHRGASLFFGRNEECGLRCVYHGWKFDVSGACVDMPNEPAESSFKDKVRTVAYPCLERAGVIWTYMGPRTVPPPFPDLEPTTLPDDNRVVEAVQRECNWLQALEGDVDTSHLAFLHLGAKTPESQKPGSFTYYTVKSRAPRYAIVDTDFGTMYGGYRDAEPSLQYWRIANFLFPFYTMIPSGVLGKYISVRAWVPMDDEHTMYVSITTPGAPGNRTNAQMLPNTTDWLGRFRLAANVENDYEIDRDAQRSNRSYTGIREIHEQDQAITESMGSIFDRSEEHLGASDVMVIRVRRRLLAAAQALAEQGTPPPGVDDPACYRVRSGGTFLPDGADWLEATQDLRRAYVDHGQIDDSLLVRV